MEIQHKSYPILQCYILVWTICIHKDSVLKYVELLTERMFPQVKNPIYQWSKNQHKNLRVALIKSKVYIINHSTKQKWGKRKHTKKRVYNKQEK